MKSQFKNPLPEKGQSANQSNDWLTGGPQPAASGDQSQASAASTSQKSRKSGPGLFAPAWLSEVQTPRMSEFIDTPLAPNLEDQPTLQQPSVHGTNAPGRQALPQTPGGFGPAQRPPTGSLSTNQSFAGNMLAPRITRNLEGPQVFVPPQHPGASSIGPGVMPGPSASVAGYNLLSQLNPAASGIGPNVLNPSGSFAGPVMNMVAPPQSPGTFNRSQSPLSSPLVPGQVRRTGELPPGRDPRSKKRSKKKRRFPIWARVLVAVLTIFIVAGAVGITYYQMNFAGAINSITNQQITRLPNEEDPNSKLNGDILSGPRINILLLGSDTDQKFQGQYLAQTDIIVTIDPASKTVGMLSIPRDFYVNVPGSGMHKLDEAFGLGGVGLSRQTIEQDFGIPINYYAWVGLDGFIKVIDEVDGVDVDVVHPIVDDSYPDDVGKHANDPYAFKRLYIPPGPQHLEGEAALEYVRSRHADLVGDFGRSARQQQVLGALRNKLENPSIFNKLSAIANDLKGFLKTDMQLADILKLMNFARTLDLNKINRLILGPPYSASGNTPDGISVVFPDCTKIVPAIANMFNLGDKAACNIQSNSGTTQPLATKSSSQYIPSPLLAAGSSLTQLSNAVGTTTASMAGGPADLFGVRSLLSLLFLGVFESPEAFQF